MENLDVVSRFADLARAYCAWVEGPAGSANAEMASAQRHLAGLYALALELPQMECVDIEAPAVSHERWQRIFQRFNVLPVNYYASIDPFNLEPTAHATVGDLADDLADIWRNLKAGLELFDGGEREAAGWEWHEHFHIHWGLHAASAMHVIACWRQTQSRY